MMKVIAMLLKITLSVFLLKYPTWSQVAMKTIVWTESGSLREDSSDLPLSPVSVCLKWGFSVPHYTAICRPGVHIPPKWSDELVVQRESFRRECCYRNAKGDEAIIINLKEKA